MIKTQFALLSSFRSFRCKLRTYYGHLREKSANFVMISHNFKMLCCDLNINFQNVLPPCINMKPPNGRLSGDGSAEIVSASGTKQIVK